jgi:hypothetical protein
MQEVLQRLGVHKIHITLLHPQSEDMVERYIRTVEEDLRKVVAPHPRDWDRRLPIFFLAYRSSTHGTAGLNPAGLLFEREFRLSSDLFGASTPLPDTEKPKLDHTANLMNHLRDTHNYALKHLELASDRMRTRFDCVEGGGEVCEG